MFVPTFLDAGAADLFEFLVLAYIALLLGCSIRFAVKVGAFSPRPCRRPAADDTLSECSML